MNGVRLHASRKSVIVPLIRASSASQSGTRYPIEAAPLEANVGATLAAITMASMAFFVIGHRAMPLAGISGMALTGVVGSVACAVGLVAALGRAEGISARTWLAGLGWTAAAGTTGFFLATVAHATSWDGQTYHLSAVMWLMDGWQPLRATPPLAAHHALAAYYPSGLWTVQAGLATLTGTFDSGRAVNVILAAAAAGAVWASLAAVPAARVKWVIAALLVANPVAVVQMPTAMLDGAVYYLTLILAVSLDRWLATHSKLWGISALGAMLVLVNAKLAGMFFTIVIVAAVLLMHAIYAWRHGVRRWMLTAARPVILVAAVGICGTLVVGYRPYVTNVMGHGEIVYPPTDVIMAGQAPSTAANQGHLGQLAHLVFSANTTVAPGGTSRLIAPWRIPIESFDLAVDNRSGGFGPAFDITVLLALAAFAVSLGRRWRNGTPGNGTPVWTCLALAMGMCVVLFPIPWWARFVPMAWAIPLALAGAAWISGGTVAKGLVCTACLAACVDASVAVVSTAERIHETRPLSSVAGSLADCQRPLAISRGRLWNDDPDLRHMSHMVWQRWLHTNGVPVAVKPRETCLPGPALGADIHVCDRCSANGATKRGSESFSTKRGSESFFALQKSELRPPAPPFCMQ